MRYPIHAPVTFGWRVRIGAMHQGNGVSRDISEGEPSFLHEIFLPWCQRRLVDPEVVPSGAAHGAQIALGIGRGRQDELVVVDVS
jgi:hypothetical protein